MREFWSFYLTTILSCRMVVAVTNSYPGNDELQLEELDALAREVTFADMTSSDGGSSDEVEDDGDFVPAVVS